MDSSESTPTETPSNRGRKLVKIIVVCVLFALATMGGTLTGLVLAYQRDLPIIQEIENYQPSIITQVFADDGEVIAEFAVERRVVIRYQDVPDHLKQAIVSYEDQRFWSHHGFDPVGMARAAWDNLRAGEIVSGASTVTQQVSRLLFLTREETYSRKIKEAILAFKNRAGLYQRRSSDLLLQLAALRPRPLRRRSGRELLFRQTDQRAHRGRSRAHRRHSALTGKLQPLCQSRARSRAPRPRTGSDAGRRRNHSRRSRACQIRPTPATTTRTEREHCALFRRGGSPISRGEIRLDADLSRWSARAHDLESLDARTSQYLHRRSASSDRQAPGLSSRPAKRAPRHGDIHPGVLER